MFCSVLVGSFFPSFPPIFSAFPSFSSPFNRRKKREKEKEERRGFFVGEQGSDINFFQKMGGKERGELTTAEKREKNLERTGKERKRHWKSTNLNFFPISGVGKRRGKYAKKVSLCPKKLDRIKTEITAISLVELRTRTEVLEKKSHCISPTWQRPLQIYLWMYVSAHIFLGYPCMW